MKANKKQMPARSFETIIRACAHDVTVRWWDIVGNVSDEELEEAAEDRVRECLAQDYSNGELNYEYQNSSACGWWGVPGTDNTPPRPPQEIP